MNVVIESDDGQEVRYACMDVDGRPYGAARVLPKKDFETVFTRERGGWRLLIYIEGVDGDRVSYRQLDAQRQPRGQVRTLSAGMLTSNFVAEAASY